MLTTAFPKLVLPQNVDFNSQNSYKCHANWIFLHLRLTLLENVCIKKASLQYSNADKMFERTKYCSEVTKKGLPNSWFWYQAIEIKIQFSYPAIYQNNYKKFSLHYYGSCWHSMHALIVIGLEMQMLVHEDCPDFLFCILPLKRKQVSLVKVPKERKEIRHFQFPCKKIECIYFILIVAIRWHSFTVECQNVIRKHSI